MDLREKYRSLRAIIVLLAALITWILNIRNGRTLLNFLIIEFIVIVAFYLVSSIAIALIDKIINMENGSTSNADIVITPVGANEEQQDDEIEE